MVDLIENVCQDICKFIRATPGALIVDYPFLKEQDLCTLKEQVSRCRVIIASEAETNVLLRELAYVINKKLPDIVGEALVNLSILYGNGMDTYVERWRGEIFSNLQGNLIQRYWDALGLDLALVEQLSVMTYETEDCSRGGLMFVPGDRDISSLLSVSTRPYDKLLFTEGYLRSIRKLLAGAGDNYLLFQEFPQTGYVFMGYMPTEKKEEGAWSVSFHKNNQWDISYRAVPFFSMHGGHPMIMPSSPLYVNELEYALAQLKDEFGSTMLNPRTRELLEKVQYQSHGAAIVFLDFTDSWEKEWISRLYKNSHGFQVLDPSPGIEDLLPDISRMDGTIIVDAHTLKVRYIAMIVDGHVWTPGFIGRGARHNSLHAFISDIAIDPDRRAHRAAAVVFSEDGGVKCYPGAKI